MITGSCGKWGRVCGRASFEEGWLFIIQGEVGIVREVFGADGTIINLITVTSLMNRFVCWTCAEWVWQR